MQTYKGKPWLYFVLGLFLAALGIAVITKANIGNAPITTLPYVLCLVFPVSLGVTTFVINALMVIAQIVILGEKFQKMQYLQFGAAFALGVFIDISLFFITMINPEIYIFKILTILIGSIFLSLGISIQLKQNLILLPGEGLIKVIADKLSKEFGLTKVAFDVSVVVISIILSFVCLEKLEGVREGTIILSLTTGIYIRFFMKKFEHINKSI